MKIAVIGSGMAGLTAGCLLANDGHEVAVLEQNYLPGGCTSSYFRQGFIFEAGATTLVGLDEGMPLRFLLDRIGVSLDVRTLSNPMQVHLPDGEVLTRHRDLEAWIGEAERVFGKKNGQMRRFWEFCYAVSRFVWDTSLQQRTFPPSSFGDLWGMARGFRWRQLRYVRYAFVSMRSVLQRYGLLEDARFVRFVDEQLLITAQNHHAEVNALFGATALCYTNYGNYYVYGGLYQLVEPLCAYIRARGGAVHLRTEIERVERQPSGGYVVRSPRQTFHADAVISAIPLNNTLGLFDDPKLYAKHARKLMRSPQLHSAFQVGVGFRTDALPDAESCLHHQIHLREALPQLQAQSIFLSLSHPHDWYRAPLGQQVASISTHIRHPESHLQTPKTEIEAAILSELEARGFINREQIIYHHSSGAAAWERWTKRAFGFVGGYPQYLQIKPWQMHGHRLDGHRAYLCGDTTYPGQGIPGACLSGIIAYEKLRRDAGW